MTDTSRHSRFLKNCIQNNIIDNNAYKGNIRQSAGLTMSSGKNQVADQRFKDPRLKAAVRTVLEHLGYESNMGNFNKVEKKLRIDWVQFADSINNPVDFESLDFIDWKKCEAEYLRNLKGEENEDSSIVVQSWLGWKIDRQCDSCLDNDHSLLEIGW